MAQKKEVLLTEEGLAKVKEELEQYRTKRRQDVANRLKDAIAQGDLSENAEYDEAKDEQAKLEADIIELEAALRNVVVIDDQDVTTDFVNVGTTVRVQYLDEDEEEEFTLVGARESDPMHNKISNESPLGSAMLRHKAGEVVTVEAPDGPYQLKILEIKL